MLKHDFQKNKRLLMKIIYIVDMLLFFKTPDLYTLDKNIGKSISSSYESKHEKICLIASLDN